MAFIYWEREQTCRSPRIIFMTDLKQDLEALRIEREPERATASRWIVWAGLVILLAASGFAGWRWATRERPVEVQVTAVSVRAAGT